MDVETELKALENSLRSLIEHVLRLKYGAEWEKSLKVTPETVANWKVRREVERKRLAGETLDSRLLYYSNFHDLRSLIAKHWSDGFSEVFGEKRRLEVHLEEMERLRDPNAHRREMHTYQKHLVLGISGQIRILIMKHRGRGDDPDTYFPKIEAVTDNLGNQASNTNYAQQIICKPTLRVGDEVEIRIDSIDPLGGELSYSIARIGPKVWTSKNIGVIRFTEQDIGKFCDINVMVRSVRNHHAYQDFDDYVMYRYSVLPAR
ncbi:Swt1 family HEPN domain-containing protein [Rhodanobacter sp. MP7CTX1]|uniref:Swt1 family HEPN domain-containing protein n=1 Tax=Rhodanobacter sp. MP7CTX1 TaxID=2723084 RepID=UPI0016184212|nr:Swt1 family HEPN domain-containing protein [Rhodanobacter sp. MP7CTX1]MBB6187008.1 hypothetical protein [Rhodanobacter sp. MP7CTX1]